MNNHELIDILIDFINTVTWTTMLNDSGDEVVLDVCNEEKLEKAREAIRKYKKYKL